MYAIRSYYGRFGQYGPYMKMVFEEMGYGDMLLISPTCEDGYSGIGEHADELLRVAWRAMVGGDLLHKLLLRVRPYETERGAADRAFDEALSILCAAIEIPGESPPEKLARIRITSYNVCYTKLLRSCGRPVPGSWFRRPGIVSDRIGTERSSCREA